MKDGILYIEDDHSSREVGVFNLKKAGYEVQSASNGAEGLAHFSPDRHALVITDVKMPGISGLEVLAAVKARAPEVEVLVITAFGNIELAVEAMKAGATDFIGKPFNREHLLIAVRKALESRRLRQEVRTLRIRSSGVERPIICQSPAMKQVLEMVDRIAPSDASVLITGDSGSGKELLARRLHVRSARAEKPFVAINCAAIPAELLEAELFGHEKGAFTGAVKARVGRFRQAHGGTLFLDEVGEMPVALQSKLLRVLQEHVVDAVGSEKPVEVDVRVVAATNQDIRQRVREGSFRADLFYRLNVVELHVPPLLERLEDIEPLVRYFVSIFAGGRELFVPEAVLEAIRARSWPGNIRELRNACERMVILCSGAELSVSDLPAPDQGQGGRATGAEAAQPAADGAPLGEWPALPEEGLSLIDLERRVIERVLQRERGNITRAAQYLRVPRHVLAYRMEKYGIQRSG